MNRSTALLNRVLDVARAEPVVAGVHQLTARLARLTAALRARSLAAVESTGLASRADLADLNAELAALTDATDRLVAAVHRLEARLDRRDPPG